MRILAFDCAGAQCAAAVVIDGTVQGVSTTIADRGLAQLLMPMLADTLAQAGIGYAAIDRFAVTTGPGSFTGIRVALAAARGLALATGKTVLGVSCFETYAAMAFRAGVNAGRLLVAIESKRDALFLQLFDGATRAGGAVASLTPDAAQVWMGEGDIAVAGNAAWRFAEGPSQTRVLAAEIDPVVLATLAAGMTPGAPPGPFYLRPPDAKPAGSGGA